MIAPLPFQAGERTSGCYRQWVVALTEIARKWTCDRCGVAVSRLDGTRAPFPESWASGIDGCFCLICRRERAGEAALDAAPADCGNDARAKLRRTGLVEFEVRRTPDRADNEIAKACRTSASAVVAVREAIGRR